MTPAQSNVVPGDSVSLRCSHTSTDRGASYAWERLDGMDMMSTGRFEASGRSGEVLRIIFAEEADSGVYVCRVTSSQGVQTGTAQVFVGKWDWERERERERERGGGGGGVVIFRCVSYRTL